MNYLTANRISDMDRILNQVFTQQPKTARKGFKIDIAESSEEYRIDVDLPGFSTENVDVRIEENLLLIEAGAPEIGENNEKFSWYLRERKLEDLKRSFLLPEDVNKEDVEAEMKNGVLSVVLKKKPEVKPVTIKVQGK